MNNDNNLPIYSYSKIKSYYNCPYYFFKNYFDKPENFIPESHGTSEFGTYVHKILEMYEKKEIKLNQLLKYYEKHYNENIVSDFVIRFGKKFQKDMSSIYYEGGKEYFKNFTGYNNLRILESEYEFYENVNNVFILHGKIDLIAEDENSNLIVIDHKSKGKFKNKKEKKEYAKQLYLYAYAVYKKYKRYPDILIFNMFRSMEWVKFEFNKSDYIDAIQWAINSVKEIESAIYFEPIPNTFYCDNFCTFRNICEYKDVT